MSATYAGPPPPRSSLGTWLLEQARDLWVTVSALKTDVDADRLARRSLEKTVTRLVAETERLSKVQVAQALEFEQVKQLASQAQTELGGLKISRGIYKSKAQKLLQDMENRLN
jgi:hypothetical protein